ncbi:hypothetical protein PSQ90_14665 [Devosia rhodophyticola]|uniref:Uncharacterized protein n=1 Tax=Devosia rhodophyticola TaxID=3026423 RepID=A0ABY7YW27_9HYPH|nr:hypothetical protein [Devosia rhodophyticola]WDR05504.1 hypothetical protein PSQ90_14665 [Devosia rhodophyticola]
MPQRPSNRELKVLGNLGADGVLGPDDFKDVGEKVFGLMLGKGWIQPAEMAGKYRITEKGIDIHDEQAWFGRSKR